jgi:hypothetical protein
VKGIRTYADVLGAPFVVAVVIVVGLAVRRSHYESTPHVQSSAATARRAVTIPFQQVESSAPAGLIFQHQKFVPPQELKNVAPLLSGLAGASVAVVDADNDGWPDIYFTNAAIGSSNALFHNNHDGTFADFSERSGIARVNETTGSLRALFFDYDNDGHDDLLLTTTYCPRVFHNRGDGTFEDVTATAGIAYCGYVTASNVVDYDGDGRLDVIIAGYYRSLDILHPDKTDFIFPRLNYAGGGGPIVVYHNEGNGRFSEVPGALGIHSRGWTHTVSVYDLRGTGHPDLYFATDFNADQVYWNDGHGGFVNGSDDGFLGNKYSRFGMSAEIGDFANDGLPGVYVTDIYEPGRMPGHNALWKMTAGQKFESASDDLDLLRCGWAWGAKFVDLDNDTHLDLAVTNGMVSGKSKKSYWYGGSSMMSGNLMGEARNWAPIGDLSWSGYQTKCVYHNEGGKLIDVSSQTDMGQDDSDGRGLAAIDFRNEGVASLVEANVGQPAHLFRTVPPKTNHWIGFALTGTRSNRDAFGTKITIHRRNGVVQSQELEPANGYEAESDHRLLFGLGPSAEIESIHVRWPLGREQDLTALAPDRYHSLTEP